MQSAGPHANQTVRNKFPSSVRINIIPWEQASNIDIVFLKCGSDLR
jgi:hypothetical protein